MPREIYPSSYFCDCGYRWEFSESTIKEIKAASMKRKQALIGDDGLHEVIFDRGEMMAVYCPEENTRKRRKRK